MFKNYLKIAVRNLLKYKAYSIINVSGLAIGIACCLLILLYIQDELSYDKFHVNADRIYRVASVESSDNKISETASTYGPLADLLAAQIPGIEKVTRIFPHSVVVSYGADKKFQEDRLFFCDSTFFDMFTFAFKNGQPENALDAPNAIVLTEETAQKYFGDENPIGKNLRAENQHDFFVTGVLESLPDNSHFSFDFIANIKSINKLMGTWVLNHGWHWPPMYTYAMLSPNSKPEDVESEFPGFIQKFLGRYTDSQESFFLQPITSIHLHSDLVGEIEPTSNITYVYIFALVALFILLIACINFMNLSTARSANRAKEVGLRKVVGANRMQLIKQFLGESLFFAVFSMLLAVALIEFFLPTFNNLVGKQLDVEYTNNWIVLAGLLVLTLFVGVTAGSYPAFFLARFRPIQAMQSKQSVSSVGKKPFRMRSILVVTQFMISIVLIIVTAGIHNQLQFIQTERLGFNKEHLVVIPVRDENIQRNFKAIKNSLLAQPEITNVTAISNFPWEQGYYGFPAKAEGMADDADWNISTFLVDHDFIETFGMEIVEGRAFSEEFGSDAGEAFILNETAKEDLGWADAINKKFEVDKVASGNPRQGRVIGVMKDFHMRSLHYKVEPVVAMVAPIHHYLDNYVIRVAGVDIQSTLSKLENKWSEFAPHRPFEYFFLDEAFDQLYRKEQRLGKIFNYFAALTIFVGCLGLFGLASFSAEQRTKEIGIRKVLGASIPGILMLLSKDFTKLILAAFIIAAPIAYLFIQRWLQEFAYQSTPGIGIFVISIVVVLLIAMLTVSYQSIRAAVANPVKALHYE